MNSEIDYEENIINNAFNNVLNKIERKKRVLKDIKDNNINEKKINDEELYFILIKLIFKDNEKIKIDLIDKKETKSELLKTIFDFLHEEFYVENLIKIQIEFKYTSLFPTFINNQGIATYDIKCHTNDYHEIYNYIKNEYIDK